MGDEYFTYATIGSLISMFLLIFLAVFVLTLVIQGIPLYKLAKKANLNNAWLSFIPIGNTYIMMMLPDSEFVFFNFYRTKKRKSAFVFYIVSTIVAVIGSMILSFIPCIGVLIAIAVNIYLLLLSYRIYADFFSTYYSDDTSVILMSIFSLIIPIVFIILLYVTMSKDKINNNNNNDYINYNL